jgi:hypothetical protein
MAVNPRLADHGCSGTISSRPRYNASCSLRTYGAIAARRRVSSHDARYASHASRETYDDTVMIFCSSSGPYAYACSMPPDGARAFVAATAALIAEFGSYLDHGGS